MLWSCKNSKDTTSNLGWRIVLRYAKVVILCEFHWSSPGCHSVPKSAKLCADLNAEFDRRSRWVTVGTNSSPNSSKRGTQFGIQLGTLILYPAPYPTLLRKGHNVSKSGASFLFTFELARYLTRPSTLQSCIRIRVASLNPNLEVWHPTLHLSWQSDIQSSVGQLGA